MHFYVLLTISCVTSDIIYKKNEMFHISGSIRNSIQRRYKFLLEWHIQYDLRSILSMSYQRQLTGSTFSFRNFPYTHMSASEIIHARQIGKTSKLEKKRPVNSSPYTANKFNVNLFTWDYHFVWKQYDDKKITMGTLCDWMQ